MKDFFNSVKTVLLEKPLSFEGRASRSEYWNFWLFSQLSFFMLMVLGLRIKILFLLFIVYYLIFLIPSFCVTVRRLHDVNKSGWWLLGALPFFIIGYLGLFLFARTQEDQTGGLDFFGVIILVSIILGISVAMFWYLFPILFFLTKKGGENVNKYGEPSN